MKTLKQGTIWRFSHIQLKELKCTCIIKKCMTMRFIITFKIPSAIPVHLCNCYGDRACRLEKAMWRDWGWHSGIAEDSCLLGCHFFFYFTDFAHNERISFTKRCAAATHIFYNCAPLRHEWLGDMPQRAFKTYNFDIFRIQYIVFLIASWATWCKTVSNVLYQHYADPICRPFNWTFRYERSGRAGCDGSWRDIFPDRWHYHASKMRALAHGT